MELITVIVPVYNVEKYLERCVESIVKQTYLNMDIILVDDGSKDSSGEIAEKLAEKDKRITVIHQKNRGLSGARNTGLDIAKGEWISFVDSDDYIEPNMYKTMIGYGKNNNADLVSCNVEKVSNEGHLSYYGDLEDKFTISSEEALKKLAVNQIINNSVNNKIYKRPLFDGLRFTEGLVFEDCDIMYRLISRAKTISYVGKPFYKYYMSPQSLLRGKFNPKLFDYIGVANKKMAFYKNECPDALPHVKANVIEEVLYITYKARKEKEYKEKTKEALDFAKQLIKEKKYQCYSKKNKIKIACFKISRHLYNLLININERR